MFKDIVWITGMPRSGTTWLSQILYSHPDIRLKFCPLFSYEFKNLLDENSTPEQWRDLMQKVYLTKSKYLDQEYLRQKGLIPSFPLREETPSVLAIKSTRFHNLTKGLIEKCPEIKWVALVRNPCASIHSWLSNPFEFPSGATPQKEWRNGFCRKNGPGEFWGFEDWKAVTSMFLELENSYPNIFRIFTYESFVRSAQKTTQLLFSWIGLDYNEQTETFLVDSQKTLIDHKRSVFKTPEVTERWRHQLDPEIKSTIIEELAGTPIADFLDAKKIEYR